ncbi:MAG: TetR/AcrR family transcriptional regulator [Nakamurella sp.]
MPPRKVHDAALRSVLLEQTSRLVAEQGSAVVSVRAVATASGTSTSAVYALFGSRERLLAAVANEAVARFAAHLAAAPITEDPVEDLMTLGRAYRRSALDDPHFYRVMFDAGPARLPAVSGDETTFGVLLRVVQRCIDAGRTRSTDSAADAERMAGTLWALVHGQLQLELAGLGAPTAAARAAAFDAVMEDIWLGLARR